jgi:hypothetical protein
MLTSTSKGVRAAAGIVCAFFAVFVLFHLLWAVGVTWGLEEIWPGQQYNYASPELTFASLIGAAAGAAVISSRSVASAGTRHDFRIACCGSGAGLSSRGRHSGP